jgi:hypothetical protein
MAEGYFMLNGNTIGTRLMAIPDLRTSISLAHVRRLTDCFGIIQHGDHMLPNLRTGYTTDDNARALVVAAQHYRLFGDRESRELAVTYLAFLGYAQREDGRFHNFFGYHRGPLDEIGSDDCLGRALTGLAYILYAPPWSGMLVPAERMLGQALPWVEHLVHPRSKAMCMVALWWWWQARPDKRKQAETLMRWLAKDLLRHYEEHSNFEWQWLLPEMTYANATLPQALLHAYQVTMEKRYLEVGLHTLDFLCEKTFRAGHLHPVGNNGWCNAEDGQPAHFDQQPVDAALMVEALLAAFQTTQQACYLEYANLALDWFFGNNCKHLPLFDPETGGCFDGLMETGVNQNRGAESTLSLLQAQLAMLELQENQAEQTSLVMK